MSSIADIRAKMNSKYGDPEEDKKQQEQKRQNNTASATATSNVEKIRNKMDSKYNPTYSHVDQSFINTFFTDAQNFLNSAKGRYGGMNSFNKDSVYDSIKNERNDLRSRSWDIRQYLGKNKGAMNEDDYISLLTLLDDFDKASISTDYGFYKAKEYGFSDNYAKYTNMSSDEIKNHIMSQEDKDIIHELMLSNMPYNREYAEQDGRDMAIYDDVEKKRKYISKKYGIRFTESSYENAQLLTELINENPVAFTTDSGQNITWERLYNNALAAEDLASRYETYSQNADWAEKSQAIDVVADTESDYQIISELARTLVPHDWESAEAYGVERATFDDIEKKRKYISEKYGVDLYSDIYNNINIYNSLMEELEGQEGETGNFENMSYLTYDEKAVLSYIYQTEGRAAALAWHNSRMGIYQERSNNYLVQGMTDVGEDYPFWGSVGSVALSIGSGVEYLTDIFDLMATGEDQSNTLALASSSIISGVTESINWEIGNWDAFDFIYNTGMSMANSVASTALMGNFGGITLGLSAAAQATNDALNRGMSQGQAFWNGLISGVFEGLFESWSIGNFSALKEVVSAHGKDIALNIAKSMLVNASEETLTEIANIAYDSIFNGDFSQYETLVRQYVVSGMEESEAKKKASLDLGQQVVESGASGAFMGLGFGGIGSTPAIANNAINANKKAAQTYKIGKDTIDANGGIDALKALAMDVSGATDSKLAKQADKLTAEKATGTGLGKVVAGVKNMGQNWSAGKVYRAVESTVTAQNKTDMATALKDSGFSEKSAKNIADAVVSSLNGETLSNFQKATLESVEGNRIVGETITKVLNDADSSVKQRAKNLAMYNLGIKLGVGVAPNAAKTAQLQQGEEIATSDGKLSTTAENASESHYEVSADGKTLNAKGDEITIIGIASVGKGKLTLKLSDGSTIDSSEVAYSSQGEAMVYEAVANMDAFIDADTAYKLVQAYDPSSGISAEVYARGLNQAYTYGFYGYKRSDMTSEKSMSAFLSEEQRNFAYEAGREYAEKHNKGKAAGIKNAYATAESILQNREKNGETVDKRGEVIFEDGLTQEQISKSKNGKQKNVAYLVAQKVSAKMGNDIHLYKGTKEFGFRAKNGDIWLNVNATADAQSMMLFTLSHELVHNAREYDPAGFKVFADFLVEQYGEQGRSVHDMVLAKQADYASQGKEISYDKAYEEVVCDACERMLLDSDALEKLQLIEQKHPGIIERIIEGIRNFLNHIREIFADVSPYADEAKFVKEMEAEAQATLNRFFENMMVDSGKHYSTIKAAFGKGTVVETNANGEFTIAKSEDGSEMLYNLATWEKGGKETLQEALETEGFSAEDIKAAMTIMDAKYDLVKKLGDEFKEQDTANKATITTDLKDGHAVLSAIVSNGDYPVNIDLLMVCKKRQAYQRVINRLCETGLIKDATLDSLAIAEINRILGSNGFETACLGCFVESRRLRIQEWANTIVKEWNGLVDKKVGKGNAKAFNFSNEKAFVENMSNEEIQGLAMELDAAYEENRLQYGKTSVVKKMAKLIDEVPSLRRHLSVADLITPEGRTRLRSLSSELNSLVACRYGSNTPKIIQAFNPYNHELAVYGKVPSKYKSLREYLYAIGGARMQSFSDFIIENWFDYCQIVADLAARKLPMHTYTKEIALVKLLGMTGIKINMSLIPDVDNRLSKEYAGLTINAKGELELIWADKDRNKATGGKSYMQSINFADAVAIQNDPRYSSNVGTIAVGISVKQIEMMLDDPRIRMIIPYHSSGMNPIFAHLVGTSFYKDFTDVQNTKVKQLYKNGKPVSLKLTKDQAGKLTSGFEFNEVLQDLGDARAAADAYKAWCADSSQHSITIDGVTYTAELTPKFSQFMEHQNYYKVLEDFNTYDSITEKAAPQGDVTQTYPEDFEDILRAELTAQDKYRQKQEKNGSFDKAMAEIESYLKTHTKADTVYYAEQNGIKLSDKDKKLDAAEKQKLKALRDSDMKLPKMGEKKSPTSLTEQDLRELLQKAKDGEMDDGTYFPVRINTPDVLLDAILAVAKKKGITNEAELKKLTADRPIAIQVFKARQSLATEDDWVDNGRPHNLSIDDVITLVKKMDDPQYIVYEGSTGRYVEVLKYHTEKGDEAFAVVELENFKDEPYLNGYAPEMYNILVTLYQPDAKKRVTNLLNGKDNIVIHPQKKKGNSQVTSGIHVPSVLNKSPFAPNVPQENNVVKTELDHDFKLPNTLRDAQSVATREALEKQNEKLREDVSYLKELLKLQKSVTGGRKITRSSVETVARNLKKEMDANGNGLELAGYLNQLYSYIAESDELTWEGIVEKAQPAVAWLREHGNMEKDSPTELSDQELLYKVYDGYWNVSTLYTVADVKQKEINKLKAEHRKRMQAINDSHEKSIANLKQQQKQRIEDLREYYHKATDRKLDAAKERYQEQRQRSVENRNKTEMRKKIRKVIRDLDKILNRGNKKTNVKEDMKDFVSKALELADYLFTDHISNEELIRRGITVRMTQKEAALVKETEGILSQLYDKADSLTDEDFTRLDAKRKSNLYKLRDLLTAQRNERLNTPVYNLFNDLVTEYASLKNSKQEAVKAAYDPNVERFLRSYIGESNGETDSDRKTLLQNMRVADMTMDELWRLHNAYMMVLHSVRDANKLWVKGKTDSIEQLAGRIILDFSKRKAPDGKVGTVIRNLSNKLGWDYEKLYYALDRIGSETFTELVMNIANSENIVMQDIIEAAAFRDEIVKKYGYNNWDVNKKIDREFLDNTGKKFNLTLGELMSLYAYSRREGAWDHIEYGGFVFGEAALTNPKPADSYKLSKEQCEAITDALTKEQKDYAEDMQKFLSETMGAKGNEVSMLLYGITMFGEKNYFPIHIAGQFKAQANESQAKAAAGFSSMSNAGFTHAQNPNAKAPFVLEGFNEIWADHVNEMSRYHGTVPALEDMRRVMNRSFYSESGAESIAIKQLMENSFGKEAVEYFDNLYREANSGAITDKLQKKSHKLLSMFRKNSVAYSLSVLVQQPASLVRAYAMIEKRHFGFKGYGAITSGVAKAVSDKWTKAHTNAYNEMLKYAPGVTMAKEIGGFDTATGGSIRSYLLDTNKSLKLKWKTGTIAEKSKAVMELVDDNVIANLPNIADKIAWIEIWNACKRDTVAKHKDLAPNSEEFMQTVGDRFTEVIRATQVYDSIFAKSPMLKSKNLAVQYLVSFMNEPNTVANMAESAVRDAIRGNWKAGVKKGIILIYSIAFTNVLKSIIYAMRDDDEEETYIEKYIEAIVGNMMNDINPLNYIPIARDVWSLVQGYDVERADMAIVADAIDAIDKVVKNATKDTEGMTEDQLIEFDKKVTEANWKLVESLAAFFGIPVKNIRREIEGVIDHIRIASANAGKTTKKSAWDKVRDAVIGSIPFMSTPSKQDKLFDAIVSGDTAYVNRLKNSYKDESSYLNAIRTAIKDRYTAGEIDYDTAIQYLVKYGGMEEDDAYWKAEEWMYESETGDDYGKYDEFFTAVETGKNLKAVIKKYTDNGVSAETLATQITNHYKPLYIEMSKSEKAGIKGYLLNAFEQCGVVREDATKKLQYWEFLSEQPDSDLNQYQVADYYEFAKPAGISAGVYTDYCNKVKGIEGEDKKARRMAVIHSMPLSTAQKDALYFAEGWAASRLHEAPWH